MSKINVVALGGLDEKNKNLYVLEIDSKIYILDCGIFEPLRDEFGIQYFTPKIDYLLENSDKIKGVFLSTANKQQIATLPQLVREIPNLRIYTSKVVAHFLNIIFPESKNWKINIVEAGHEFNVDGQAVEAIEVPAAIPQTYGYIFKTKDGNVVYLTDYISENISDFHLNNFNQQLEKLSHSKTLLMMSDSLNGNVVEPVSTKYKLTRFFESKISDTNKRIVASVYEDEIVNIVEIILLAKKYNKKVFFLDNKILNLTQYLMDQKLIDSYLIKHFENQEESKHDSVVIVTGSRTDLYVKLQGIIISESNLVVKQDDIVFLASTPQAGNEHVYAEIANDLARIEPTIVEIPSREKLSIHPSQADLKNVVLKIKPQHFMPIKGYYKELIGCRKVLYPMNYTEKQIVLADNGDVFSFENGSYQGLEYKAKKIGDSIIQLVTDSDIELDVIKHRQELASDGILTVAVIIDKNTKEIKSNIDIQMRGVIFVKTQDRLMGRLHQIVVDEIKAGKSEWILNRVESKINKEITKEVKAATKKSPQTVIQILEA